MLKFGLLPIKTTSVATATFTKLVNANDNRRYLEIINDSGVDIYIAYTDTAPTDVDSATNGMKLLLDGENNIWDATTGVPITPVYVYQSSGGAVNVKYSEGV